MEPSVFEEENRSEVQSRTWPTKLMASCLVVVMLCSVVSAPILLAYRYFSEETIKSITADLFDRADDQVNRVAYVSSDGSLATIAPNGSDKRNYGGQYQLGAFPAWSPDARSIGISSDKRLIVIQDSDESLEQGQYQVLFQDAIYEPFYIFWSPAGDYLSFLTGHPSGLALRANNSGSSTGVRELAVGQSLYWDWQASQDGILLHKEARGEDSDIAFIDLDGVEEADIVAAPGSFRAPSFSIDGQLFAFVERDDQRVNHLAVHDQGGETVFKQAVQGSIALNWNPKQALIAYIEAASPFGSLIGSLNLIDVDSGSRQTLIEDNVATFFWSPDGNYLAYLRLAGTSSDSFQVDAPRRSKGSVAKSAIQQSSPQFELVVYDLESGDFTWLLEFQPTQMFLTQFVPFFDQYNLSHRIWSPASDALLIPLQAYGNSHLFVVPIDGAQPIEIDEAEIGFWSPK
jgi:TolB protein